MILTRILAGLVALSVGYWMTAVQSPPDPGGWSIVACVLLLVGAVVAGTAALELLDRNE